jgi:hypothetical protein
MPPARTGVIVKARPGARGKNVLIHGEWLLRLPVCP